MSTMASNTIDSLRVNNVVSNTAKKSGLDILKSSSF